MSEKAWICWAPGTFHVWTCALGGWDAAAAATLTLVGALAERFAIVEAGKVSADDPLAYQELTREARGEARPTAEEQARKAPKIPRTRAGVSARDRAEQRER